MAYKWKPSKTQRREFAIKMQDPEEKRAYEERKANKRDKMREGSKFDYSTAGGFYVPTQFQYEEALKFKGSKLTDEQDDACNQVMYGYSCQEKIHHDYIHIINELLRNKA